MNKVFTKKNWKRKHSIEIINYSQIEIFKIFRRLIFAYACDKYNFNLHLCL